MKKKALLQALVKTLGVITPACEIVGISRNQFYIYYREDEAFRNEVEEIQELTLDFAETKLLQKIKEGSEKSILFYMKYKGRKRGYIDKIDVNNNISGDLNNKITIEIIKNKDENED